MPRVLIVGCGYTGRRLAALHRPAPTLAFTGQPASAEALRADGLTAEAVDLDRPVDRTPQAFDTVYMLAPPPRDGETDPRTGRLLDWLAARPPACLIYLSTSGVYGNHGGTRVDESTPTSPESERSRRRLDAERQALAFGKKHETRIIIVRAAAIYGPGRLPLKRLRDRRPVPAETTWSNRIHVDDLARILYTAAQKGRHDGIYHGTDDEPAPIRDWLDAVADHAGLPRPPRVPLKELMESEPGLASFARESKRLQNGRLRTDLGMELQYPTYREGLASLFPGLGPRA